MTEEIKINSNEGFKDEIFCTWYQCLECKNDMIMRESNYCPGCGKKIIWTDSE